MAKEIEEEHYGYGQTHSKHNPAHTRERIDDLKDRLAAYAQTATGEKLKCSLPDSKRGEGFKLKFEKVVPYRSPSAVLWAPHLDMAENVRVICGSRLFFFDPEINGVFRYYDLNVNSTREDALAALTKHHPEAIKPNLRPLLNFYLATGEVEAHAALQRWFHENAKCLIPLCASRDTKDDEVAYSAPILLGRPDTNPFIRRIMDSSKAKHLAYRIHLPLGAIKIIDPKPEELLALSRFEMKDGVLSPFADLKTVFCVFTRLANPSGFGPITIVTADYYLKVIAQVMKATTLDKLANELLEQINWVRGSELPESFEILFLVELSPADFEAEGKPKFICWRAHHQEA